MHQKTIKVRKNYTLIDREIYDSNEERWG